MKKQMRLLWISAAALLLLAGGCATPPKARVADEDWVAHSTNGRNEYRSGRYDRAADAYWRAVLRAGVIDDPAALAMASVNWVNSLFAGHTVVTDLVWMPDLPLVPAIPEAVLEKAAAQCRLLLADPRTPDDLRAGLWLCRARAELVLKETGGAAQYLKEAAAYPLTLQEQARGIILDNMALLQDHSKDVKQMWANLEKLSDKEWAQVPLTLQADRVIWQAILIMDNTGEFGSTEPMALLEEAVEFYRRASAYNEMAQTCVFAANVAYANGDVAAAVSYCIRAIRGLYTRTPLPPDALKCATYICRMAEIGAETSRDGDLIQQVLDIRVTLGLGADD